MRLINDLNNSETNRYAFTGPPIKLPTWDLLVGILLRLKPANRDWVSGKAGRSAAYKNVPDRPSYRAYATIALENPTAKCLYAFGPKTQISGPTASVPHYNVISRVLVTILNRAYGSPTIGYYDDYGFLHPAAPGADALSLVMWVCPLPGVVLKGAKCMVASAGNFLGRPGVPPSRDNDFTLTISPTPD